MGRQFEVRAFQIARIATHGAICSDDWGAKNPVELHSDFGRYAVVNVEWFDALEPVVGSWVIEYSTGHITFRSAEDFPKDCELIEGQWYRTSWPPPFEGVVLTTPPAPMEA